MRLRWIRQLLGEYANHQQPYRSQILLRIQRARDDQRDLERDGRLPFERDVMAEGRDTVGPAGFRLGTRPITVSGFDVGPEPPELDLELVERHNPSVRALIG